MLIAAAGLILAGALYLWASAIYPLSEPDEGRYAEIAREMLESGDWITPHLNYVEYFEKPPLVYWATAASFAALGPTELAARLPVVVSGMCTLAVALWLAARLYGATTAALALPVLALSPLFAIMAQVLTLDMPLTALLTAAQAAGWGGWTARDAGSRRRWYRVAYAATAGAVLVKGPVAVVLVAASAGTFLLVQGGWKAVRAALDWRGMALALAIAAPWFALVSWRSPEFVHFFVVEQHLARYLWTHEHGEPIWFFLPVLAGALAPWSLAMLGDPAMLAIARSPARWTPATRFLVIWAGVVVAFFSVSASKLITYILPALPPLAILAARGWHRALAAGRTAGFRRLAWVFLAGGPLMAACGAVLPLVVSHWRMPLIAPALLAGGPVMFATGWGVRAVLRRGRPLQAYAALAIGWLALLAVATTGRVAANAYRPLGQSARAAMGPADRLAIYGPYVQSVPFYSRRRVIMIAAKGELTFGSEHGDHAAYFWPSADDLRREWARPGRLFVVIKRDDLARLDPPLDPSPTVLAAHRNRLLVVNR